MIILDGKAQALTIRSELKARIAQGTANGTRPPSLCVINLGQDPASHVYVRNKTLACQEVGIMAESCLLDAQTKEEVLLAKIATLNQQTDIDGILVQLPLPPHINAAKCLLAIDPKKDVDGFHPENAGRLTLGLPGLKPCTPLGIMELLRRYNFSLQGRKAVVVGRSNIVGKPLALMLAEPLEYANATVTLCHSKTRNLQAECKQADFLFLAIGQPKAINHTYVREGAVVIDVGINRTPNGLCGDADFADLQPIVQAMTPVPGGVGPMTVAMLLHNTVQVWEENLSTKAKA
ncbi:MAG: bifunctional methylenetetrahydrofolate dehydrogenase/methenyltetrahydrofolate cyclohydrolase FolD [Desulfovibrionaceae bacterium]|nr:bifunctional methylenetetrahydrofolate dehydrogenase/methenyltetrahydrofolate cyclohydrolase FolD [Desulfovibrionaceae bacterium]